MTITGQEASGADDAPAVTVLATRGGRAARMPSAGTLIASGWIGLLAVVALLAPIVAPHNPNSQDLARTYSGVSGRHWLGTDDLGRDVLSRLVFGARISMRVSFEVVGLAFAAALPVGLFSGYRGGRVDNVLMRIMDGGLSFPPLVLALAVAGVLGAGVNNEALAIAVVFVPAFCRLIRGQTLAVREELFVEASHAVGTRPAAIVARRILPNVMSAAIVQASLALGVALVTEAGLSFLGLGVAPPNASWGSMLREAYDNALFTHPWSLVVPGAAIALAVLAFNTVGDGLASALGVARGRRRRRSLRRRPSRTLGLTSVVRTREPDRSAQPRPTAQLSIDGLTIDIDTPDGPVRVVDDLSLHVEHGRILGLVGESGSGKTVTSLAIMRLLPSPPVTIVGGTISFDGCDLLGLGFGQMRRLRGNDIAIVFQDPMTSLNPVRTIGAQLVEAIRLHEHIARPVAARRAEELLARVGISDPVRRARSFPHELSGGMRQRVMIAMALSGHPRLLIADEPTTALDVTVQAEILELLRALQREERMAVILVTHDLGVVADLCDDIAVMYAGQIIETGTTAEIFTRPTHPYTEGLLAATRTTGSAEEETPAIPGLVPMLGRMPHGCRFNPRCAYAIEACRAAPPALIPPAGHRTRCLRAGELTLRGTR